jgi:uncharacterized LabA/DUF88 family protein
MTNISGNQEQSLLLDVLKAIIQNQKIHSLLEDNLDKLNENFPVMLRQWTKERFSKEPTRAVNIARVVVKFCKQLQQFEKGNIAINTEIAIAGYEAAISVFTIEAFPLERGAVQQALDMTLKRRQKILSAKNAVKNTIIPQKEIPQVVSNSSAQIERPPQELSSKATVKVPTSSTQSIVTQPIVTQSQQLDTPKIPSKDFPSPLVSSEIVEDVKSLIVEFQELKQRHKILEQLVIKVTDLPESEQFNTGIFYDIDNLINGINDLDLEKFSLKDIKKAIHKKSVVDKIAVQCAYADWSNSKLKNIHSEIQEMGIEKAQVFDFGHGRNAADIQLTIDVIEFVHGRPNLQVFVIVSGDGAFASLAKKLHEYGKTVIVCAYTGRINRVLKSVCDDFIPLPLLEEKVQEHQNNYGTNTSSKFLSV